MGYADLIAKEVEILPPDQQAKVLAMVREMTNQLQPDTQNSDLPRLTPEQQRQRQELAQALAPFRLDTTGFRFDRDEAHAR